MSFALGKHSGHFKTFAEGEDHHHFPKCVFDSYESRPAARNLYVDQSGQKHMEVLGFRNDVRSSVTSTSIKSS
jgi:hypothetical protein